MPVDKITIIEIVYYRRYAQQPTCVEARYTLPRDSENQQPYVRTNVEASEEWKELDTGWVDEVGMIFVRNDTGKALQVIPSDEEKQALTAQIIELSFDRSSEHAILVPPKAGQKIIPSGPLFIRSQSGTPSYLLQVMPK